MSNERIRNLVNEVLLDLKSQLNKMERRGVQSMVEEKFALNPALTDEELTTIVKNTVGSFQVEDKNPEPEAKNHLGQPISVEQLQTKIKELTYLLNSPNESEKLSADRELKGLLENNQHILL